MAKRRPVARVRGGAGGPPTDAHARPGEAPKAASYAAGGPKALEPAVSARGDGSRLAVIVSPRSSRSGVTGLRDGALAVALRAPPVEGAANAELVELLARALGVAKARVTVAGGAQSKRKLVDVAGLDAAAVRALLAPLLEGP